MSVSVTVYDGAGVIGGNKILLEAGGTSLWLDFGAGFARRSDYFEEYLNPRSNQGLKDLLVMGLLPPLAGIYRRELVPPGLNFGAELAGNPLCREVEVAGVLLTHAHLDHSGYISFLDLSIPVYSSLLTAVIAKSIQDTSANDLEFEVAYAIPREEKFGLLAAANYRTAPARGRPFRVVDGGPVPDAIRAFWNSSASARGLEGASLTSPASPAGTPDDTIGGLRVRFHPVDHSIPGAGAFSIETPAGWVVYTGDLRLHGQRGGQSRQFVEDAARLEPLALICEGTHPDVSWPWTEAAVYENARLTVEWSRGLVIADFGPRNVERLLTFRRIARETGRRLAVTARDAYLLEAMSLTDPDVPDPRTDDAFVVYADAKLNRPTWERVLLERYGAKVLSARGIRRAERDFLLCLSFYDLSELIDLRPEAGTYIYSSSEAFSEEMRIDLVRLRNWLTHFGVRLVGDPEAGETGGRSVGRRRSASSGLHASGHIHGPGLAEMIERIHPRCVIPVHTESAAFFRKNVKPPVKLLIPTNGVTLELRS